MTKAVESLWNDGLIEKPIMMMGGHFIINGITSNGMEYVEENLLTDEEKVQDGLSDTDRLMKSGAKVTIDVDEDSKEIEPEEIQLDADIEPEDVFHTITEIPCKIKGMNVSPCFSVESLAKSFVSQLDLVSKTSMDNVSMVGLFAPWGRGKSYFFRKVKEVLASRNKDDIQYNVIEFNAWKYQDTPAVWAYLFETIFNAQKWYFRIGYTIVRNIGHLLMDVLVFLIPIILASVLPKLDSLLWPTIIISSCGFFLKNIIQHWNTALSLIRKYGKEVSYESYLGVQAEIEKELNRLLKFRICKKQAGTSKILLYIEDIDRCDSVKMVDLIESIRTVLEDSEIRKRLVVVCSADLNRLSRAIQLKYKDVDAKEAITDVVRNQIDKLFISSVSLPDLDIHQEREFIEKLVDVKAATSSLPISPKDMQEVINAKEMEDEDIQVDDFDEAKVIGYIVDYLGRENLILTPRQISNVYYRCVLALRLLRSSGTERANKTIIEEVIYQSYEVGFLKDTLRINRYGNILQIVVPSNLE